MVKYKTIEEAENSEEFRENSKPHATCPLLRGKCDYSCICWKLPPIEKYMDGTYWVGMGRCSNAMFTGRTNISIKGGE